MPQHVYPLKVSRRAMRNYCYVVTNRDDDDAILVDPAFEMATIEAKLRETNSHCSTILLTHAHHDHTDLARRLALKHQARVFMSRVEIDTYGFRCPNLVAIEDSQSIPFGSGEIVPLLTPGHTSGGMCYLVGNSLFTGDTLFTEGCGMCLGKGADPEAMYQSLQRLKKVISPQTRIYPGHSYGMEPGQQFSRLLNVNIYLQFKTSAAFVAFRMRPGQTGWTNFS